VTADELARLLERDEVTLLDVRTRAEYEGEAGYPCDPRQGHIVGAVHLNVDELHASAGDPATLRELLHGRGVDPERRLVAYCHSGQRSEIAAALLRGAGVDAVNFPGSWHEWSRRPE
jgi:thiosulfate/3-mercaptopyruvate sulfurtransferase